MFFFSLPFGVVVDGLLELLAQRRGSFNKGSDLAMAHLPWSLHIWFSGGDGRNRAAREVDILANE